MTLNRSAKKKKTNRGGREDGTVSDLLIVGRNLEGGRAFKAVRRSRGEQKMTPKAPSPIRRKG